MVWGVNDAFTYNYGHTTADIHPCLAVSVGLEHVRIGGCGALSNKFMQKYESFQTQA